MLFAHPYSTKDERKEALGHHHHQRLDHENALKHIYTQNELNTERLFSPIPALIEQRMRKQGVGHHQRLENDDDDAFVHHKGFSLLIVLIKKSLKHLNSSTKTIDL